jgi:hypothetical protein
MRAGMTQVFALEVNFGPANLLRQPLSEIERRFSPGIFAQIQMKVPAERGIPARFAVSCLELRQCRHESLGHIASPVRAEVTAPVRHSWQQ